MEKKIALLVDVDNVKISGEAFNELYTKLNNMGEVVYCKFYGYNDRKHIYLSDVITKYGYETAPFMRFKKRFSQLDTRIIVDAVALNFTKPEINSYCIVAGDGDLIPLLVELKSSGRTLIDINTPYQEQNYHMFDTHLIISNMGAVNQAYQPRTKKDEAKVVTKKVTKVKKAAPAPEPAPAPAPVVEAPVVEEDYDFEEEDDFENARLSEVLRDITTRYAALDFSNSTDMDKKLELINDIENLIEEETSKGEGLNSNNADVRQIFVELQSIVDDMKSAL